MLQVKVKKLHPDAKLPKKSFTKDSGADLCSIEDAVLVPGEVRVIKTGIAIALPCGHEGQVRSRSGLSAKSWVQVHNSPGTVDEPYRNELGVILHNDNKTDFKISKGDRIAQMVVMPVPPVEYIEVQELDNTDRGQGGFGSTGVK